MHSPIGLLRKHRSACSGIDDWLGPEPTRSARPTANGRSPSARRPRPCAAASSPGPAPNAAPSDVLNHLRPRSVEFCPLEPSQRQLQARSDPKDDRWGSVVVVTADMRLTSGIAQERLRALDPIFSPEHVRDGRVRPPNRCPAMGIDDAEGNVVRDGHASGLPMNAEPSTSAMRRLRTCSPQRRDPRASMARSARSPRRPRTVFALPPGVRVVRASNG